MSTVKAELNPRRDVNLKGTTWRLYEAWRTDSHLGLGYFMRADLGPGDRRAVLEPGQSLEAYDDDALESLWVRAAEITVTERRLVDANGDVWLAQDIGPTWSEGYTVTAGVGIHFRCISSSAPTVILKGRTSTPLSDEELLRVLEANRG